MRDEYCSLMVEPITSLTTETHFQQQGSRNHPIPIYNSNVAERDQVMENLQKLLDAHHNRRILDQQQGCNSRATLDNLIDTPSCSSSISNNSNINIPLLLPLDARSAILKSTIVAGQLLSCFVIGGECRICFPQMKALCLGEIPTNKIDETMKALAIINPHASEEQLNILKKNHIIPTYLPKCELITKTNAERMISMLKSTGLPRPYELQNEILSTLLRPLNVVHDCFGGCTALLYTSMVPNPCFECRTCHLMFKPEDFCGHTHQPVTDRNTCFWGFDASNWPYYIRIDDGDNSMENGFSRSIEDAENQLASFIQNYPMSHSTH